MSSGFRYDGLPVFSAFERVSDPSIYTPLPDDWVVGIADVVKSTEALRAGRYKAVNMAGAAIVAAVKNAVGANSFPFVFGGDGAIVAVPAEAAEGMRQALAATVNHVAAELGLTLRVGALTVGAIRAAGHDMRVARYAASDAAVYAMLAGGGASYAEAELKAGRVALDPAPLDARPDLSGLSCRWAPQTSRRGVILSLVVQPAVGASAEAFRRVASEVIALTQAEERGGHPLQSEGPEFSVHLPSLKLEAAAKGGPARAALELAKLTVIQTLGTFMSRSPRRLPGFDFAHYRAAITDNSDFRKFDDGLRMTIDCLPASADRLEALLQRAEAEGIVEYGTHRQDAALITCLVPSIHRDDHLHFLDGAGGGYAFSAQALKEKRGRREARAG